MTLNQAVDEYGKSIIEKDCKKTVSFIYSKLFDYVPRKALEQSLEQAYLNQDIDVQINNYKLDSVRHSQIIDGIEYLIVKTSFVQKIRFVMNGAQATEEANHYLELLKERYGEDNVSFDVEKKQITANSTSEQLAVRENTNWSFLEIKSHTVSLYSNFLPLSVVAELQKLFPIIEEEYEIKEGVGIEKLNSVTHVEKDKGFQALYLLGWEVFLNGDEQCMDFIATQTTNKETFEFASVGLELIFLNKKLNRVYEYNDGIRVERKLKEEELGLPYLEFKENKILSLVESEKGFHQLGGELPDGFQLPDNNCVVPFQYLGYISNQDKNFEWLPFVVHLTCPVYLNFTYVFLDYSDPNKPVIINRQEVESSDTSYDEDLDPKSEIVFNEMKFFFNEDVTFSVPGNSGIPHWIQYPDIPVCPRSGKRMTFLCQFNGGVTVKKSNVKPKNVSYKTYYEELNFWGDGDLFVFFEPTSKVACYFIQNT